MLVKITMLELTTIYEVKFTVTSYINLYSFTESKQGLTSNWYFC